jgi:hypothetical protein
MREEAVSNEEKRLHSFGLGSEVEQSEFYRKLRTRISRERCLNEKRKSDGSGNKTLTEGLRPSN